MEPIQCSETLVFNTQTPGKYPEDNLSLLQHGESLKSKMFISFIACYMFQLTLQAIIGQLILHKGRYLFHLNYISYFDFQVPENGLSHEPYHIARNKAGEVLFVPDCVFFFSATPYTLKHIASGCKLCPHPSYSISKHNRVEAEHWRHGV